MQEAENVCLRTERYAEESLASGPGSGHSVRSLPRKCDGMRDRNLSGVRGRAHRRREKIFAHLYRGSGVQFSRGEDHLTTEMTVKIGGLTFANPVLVASGTFGYGDECSSLVDVNRLGGIVTKSLSLEPRDGNPPVRIVETPGGMLNSIGLANIGVEKFISGKLPYLRTLSTNVIVNIAASSVDEYCAVLERLEQVSGIHGYEINVSWPNVQEGGVSFGIDRL